MLVPDARRRRLDALVAAISPSAMLTIMRQPDWALDDAERVLALFPNQGLHRRALLVASAHPRAVQYLEQAPILALMVPSPGLNDALWERQARAWIRHKIEPLCEAGAPLKTMIRAVNFAPPLRAISGRALEPTAGPVIARLSRMDPAVLGRIIPAEPKDQRHWLRGLAYCLSRMAQRLPREGLFDWAAERLGQHRAKRGEWMDVYDFATQPDAGFSPAWRWPRAVEEAARWHATLDAEKLLTGLPFTPDTVIDLGPHPDLLDLAGLTFAALRTPRAIVEEGSAMRHCVGTYVKNVVAGHTHIVSVRRNGERLATMELTRNGSVCQLKGRYNAEPALATKKAAMAYSAEVARGIAAWAKAAK